MSRGADTSVELTEIRTVLGRAKSARKKLLARPGSWMVTSGNDDLDPEREQMLAALDEVINKLARWERQR